jgi:hypothetical protein
MRLAQRLILRTALKSQVFSSSLSGLCVKWFKLIRLVREVIQVPDRLKVPYQTLADRQKTLQSME